VRGEEGRGSDGRGRWSKSARPGKLNNKEYRNRAGRTERDGEGGRETAKKKAKRRLSAPCS